MRVENQPISHLTGNESPSVSKSQQTEDSDTVDKAKDTKSSAKEQPSVSSNLSARGRELAIAKKVALAAPDSREAKIAELRRRIANKEYNVKPEAVADRMVEEHLATRELG